MKIGAGDYPRRMATKKGAAKAAMPAALVKRAEKLAAGKAARLRAEGKQLIALVRRRRAEVSSAFYEMGVALRRLKAPEMKLALGYTSFDAFCKDTLGIASEVAARLIELVTTMTEEEAIAAGPTRAFALVEVAQATPEADTPGQLLRRGKVRVPSGREVDTRKASSRALLGAAKEIRAARPKTTRRGRTATAEERETAARIEAALHAAGVSSAKAAAVATKPGAESTLRLEHVPFSKLATLAKILAKRARR